MSKKEQLENLFARWQEKHSFQIFCPDGIVNERQFGEKVPPVVFLLKDANVSFREEANVAQNLLNTANGQNDFQKMWKVLCMWSAILENKNIKYSDCCNAKMELQDSLKFYLNQIAIVNVCKEHGKGTNTQEEIDAKIAGAVHRYYDFVKEEIDIIEPALVVCCGTYPFIQNEYNEENKICSSGAKHFFNKDRLYIEMMHPASRLSYPVLFAYFKEVLSEFKITAD